MSEMIVLGLRDPNPNVMGLGVTAAALYRIDSVDANRDWPALKQRRSLVPCPDDLLRGRSVCFLVHGFNVDLDHGVRSQGAAAQVLQSISNFTQPANAAQPKSPA